MDSPLEITSITSRRTPFARREDPGPRTATAPPLRSFDPVVVGRLEAAAWMAYYRREWGSFLALALTLSRRVLRLSWPSTVRSAWLVLRAVRLWAPLSDNDPARARRAMQRFYGLAARAGREAFDPVVAADLEVEWWRVHRAGQYDDGGGFDGDGAAPALTDALARLYAHVYAVPERSVVPAARRRAAAMALSDRWVSAGCHREDPLMDEVRAELIASYAALAAAVDAP